MTYRNAQKILEEFGRIKGTTLVQEMIYSDWVAPNTYDPSMNLRNWDDEMSQYEIDALNEYYAFEIKYMGLNKFEK